jgi:CheY-like chemotaxis protein
MDYDVEILIAEDDEGHFLLTRKYFENQGIKNRITWYRGGVEILGFFFNSDGIPKQIDPVRYVLLLDLRMPGIDGMRVLKKVRSHNCFSEMPIVIVSSSSDPDQIDKAVDAGADAYIVKPIRHSNYIEAMRKIGMFPSVIDNGMMLKPIKHIRSLKQ